MRAKRNGYGVQESYAVYGLAKNRAKVLLKECRAGKHTDLLRAAAQQAEPRIAKWIIQSIAEENHSIIWKSNGNLGSGNNAMLQE